MEKIIETLLDAFKESAKRTRNIFSIINIASILLLIGFFNYRFSWQRHLTGRVHYMEQTYQWNQQHLDKVDIVCNWLELDSNKTIMYDKERLVAAVAKIDTLKIYDEKPSNEHKEPDSYFLSIPIIGIKIYIQDIPLLGGFATSILLTWFFYARRREKSIINELSKKIKLCKFHYPDLISQIFYGISFNAIFNTIPKLDNDSRVRFRVLSKLTIYLLILAPSILLFGIQVWDSIENHIDHCGQKHQKYIVLNSATHQYLVGEEIDYFCSNFKIKNIENKIVNNVPTYEYANIIYSDPINHKIKKSIKNELIIIQVLAWLFIIFSVMQTINTLIIINEEKEMKKIINDTYDEYQKLIENSSKNDSKSLS